MNGYLAALALTLAVEVPLVALVYPGQRRRMATCCAAATAFTHLVMHFVLPRLFTGTVVLVAGETLALALEALAYALVSRPRDGARALLASALANGASFGVGLLIFRPFA
jgi:hypothetical protein